MGPRALSPLASLRLKWLLVCGLLGPVLGAGRPGGCRGDGAVGAPGGAARRGGRPEPVSADRSPAAACTQAVRSPLPGCS